MSVQKIIQLGHSALYEIAEPVMLDEMPHIRPVIADLHDTMMDFRLKFGFGRAIAAPQIGVPKRLVYMFVNQPMIFINPALSDKSRKILTVWDNCMSFPQLSVKVERHQSCRITYRDLNWREKTELIEDDLSELLQHECDHLDGILAIQRAIDLKSFAVRGQEAS